MGERGESCAPAGLLAFILVRLPRRARRCGWTLVLRSWVGPAESAGERASQGGDDSPPRLFFPPPRSGAYRS